MILVSTLLAMEAWYGRQDNSSPLATLWQCDRSPLLGSVTSSPFSQLVGIFCVVHTRFSSWYSRFTMSSPPSFKASARCYPTMLPFHFQAYQGFADFCFGDPQVWIAIEVPGSSWGGNVPSIWSFTEARSCPVLSLTGLLALLVRPLSSLVFQYRVFRSPFRAVSSALLATSL